MIEKQVTSRLTRRTDLRVAILGVAILSIAISALSLRSFIGGDEAAIVGVLGPLNIIMITLLVARERMRVAIEKENTSMDTTSLAEISANKTINNTAGFLGLSYTDMCLRKTNGFKIDISSSENQITLSSYRAPRRAHLVKRQLEKRRPDEIRGRTRAHTMRRTEEGKIKDGSRNKFNPAKPVPT